MGNVRPCLSKTSSDRFQHFLHSRLSIQSRTGFFVRLNVCLDFLLHFRVDFFTLDNLKKNFVDLWIQNFMLGVEVSIFNLKTVSFEDSLVKFIFNTSQVILCLFDFLGLFFIISHNMLKIFSGIIEFLFISNTLLLKFINLIFQLLNLSIQLL